MGFFKTHVDSNSRSIQYLQEGQKESLYEKIVTKPLRKCQFYKICHRNRGLLDIILLSTFCIYMKKMDGRDLSSVLTLSAVFEVLSYLPLLYSNSMSPLTCKLLIIVLTFRNGILFKYRGSQPYLPTDSSGKHVFPLCKFLSLIGVLIVYYRSSRRTLATEYPIGENKIILALCAIATFTGYFFYADLIEFPLGDRIFAAITLIETAALVPQFRRILNYDYSSDDVPWLICSLASQLCSFLFWYLAFEELRSYMHFERFTSIVFMFCWLSQICICCAMLVLHYVNVWWKRYGHTLYLEKGNQQKYMAMSTVI